jgi:pyrimidine operon attenuation protein / uracil phosphoribosyltransferase
LENKVLLSSQKLSIILQRLSFQLYEQHGDLSKTVIIGLQPRGVHFAQVIWEGVKNISGRQNIPFGILDTTFHRDDFRRGEPLKPERTSIDFLIEGKNVVLIDDVLYTGRSVRAAMDALTNYGRPNKVELMVLVDRRYSRELPIDPNYVGSKVDTRAKDRVKVFFDPVNQNNQVLLITDNE